MMYASIYCVETHLELQTLLETFHDIHEIFEILIVTSSFWTTSCNLEILDEIQIELMSL